MDSLVNNPLVVSMLFYPRRANPGGHPHAIDGSISVAENIALGYRLYPHQPESPLVVYFHGNGEIASDYDMTAPYFHQEGLSLVVFDYRGYGWSTGQPLTSALLSDVEPLQAALPDLMSANNLKPSAYYLMGRSLGGVPASQMAALYPHHYAGLILESTYARALPLFLRLGITMPTMGLGHVFAKYDNIEKVRQSSLPLLVIHGERDSLIPVKNGQDLYDASPAAHKVILRIPGAEHNDIMFVGLKRYFQAIRDFVAATTPQP